MRALTDRQEKFVAALIETGSGAEAARRAGYSPHTARAIASENLTKPNVLAAIEERRAMIAREHAVTVDTLMADLRKAKDLAMSQGRPSAAVSAIMAMAKLGGLIEGHRHRPLDPYEALSDEELEARIAELDAAIKHLQGANTGVV